MLGFLVITLMTTLLTGVIGQGYEQPYYSHSNGNHGGSPPGDGSYMSDWTADWTQAGLQNQKCINIPQNMSLCKNIGYNQMRLPNLLDHDTIREVTQQASSWVPLLGIRCHPDTKLFLCSLFSPVCLDRPIWPCRTLCEAVKNGCEALMLKYGFPWPEMLRCDKFPLDNDLCIGLQHDNKPVETPTDDSQCSACNQPDTFEAIADNYCSAEFVFKVRIEENVINGADLKVTTSRKKKKVKQGSVTKRELRSLDLYIKNGANCECPHVTGAQSSRPGGKRAKVEYLAMGSRQGNQLVLQYLTPFDRSKKDIKKAWKAMTTGDLCKNGLESLNLGMGKKRRKANRKPQDGEEVRNEQSPGTIVETNNNMPDQQADNSQNRRDRDGDRKKKRKRCKNPKKCTQTGGSSEVPDQRRGRDRNNRRRSRQRGYRDIATSL